LMIYRAPLKLPNSRLYMGGTLKCLLRVGPSVQGIHSSINLHPVVRSAIQRASYAPSPVFTIQFTTSASKITVESGFSHALSKGWAVILLWIPLIYPFIWLYRLLYGGRWEVAGSAFPLRAWRHCEDSVPGESVEQYRRRTFKERMGGVADQTHNGTDGRTLAETPDGVSQLVGTTERDWFQTWESTIMWVVLIQVIES
jgi:hypothetical protein